MSKDAILRATYELIEEGGIEAVNLRAVGKRAGLSRGAPYRHFENKEALLAAIVVQNFETLHSQLIARLQDVQDETKQLSVVMDAYYEFGVNNASHYHLMFGIAWDANAYPQVQQAAFKVFATVSQIVDRSQESRRDSLAAPTEITAILYAFLHGLVGLSAAGHSEISKGLHAPQHLMAVLLKALNQS